MNFKDNPKNPIDRGRLFIITTPVYSWESYRYWTGIEETHIGIPPIPLKKKLSPPEQTESVDDDRPPVDHHERRSWRSGRFEY
jgi:hypothetical protein